ncbi:MAG: DUF86 domain-containing protein [Actinobacteria bacterium]|nr:DUF86 domain-containing protein [Actinomycetota bacterium]
MTDDPNALPAAKYRLIVAIEAATDAAEHVIASEELRPATSFADSFRSLEEGGWLGSDLAAHLSDTARFRNLLVHQYADIDDGRVLSIIRDRLADLETFAEELAARLS